MKRVCILGSTGSIGKSTLEVIKLNRDSYEVFGLACNTNIALLLDQVAFFKPKVVAIKDEKCADEFCSRLKATNFDYSEISILTGDKGVEKICTMEYDILVNALVGIAGLVPTYRAIETGHTIALANKETLVAGGELIMELARKNEVSIYPIDSEHSAIFQSIQGSKKNEIKKLFLTCSGGPFIGRSISELKNVRVQDALNHPNWSMGNKITIDSATLMNKGFEIIEAKWLFNIDADDIEVIIHPESVLHSAVMFTDNSIIGQLGTPDMKIPIGYALSYPERKITGASELDISKLKGLSFKEPDLNTFECLALALYSIKKGNSYPVVLNAANEVLVTSFLNEDIGFLDIQRTLKRVIENHSPVRIKSLDDILHIDEEARKTTMKMIEEL
ncbi:MAG: 1-deoxy-D-xylulose-5-phosphate reductoisomerase [Enterococcus sp.]|nr:1-deoxy-D-xylulose-5-phosphate reductoisomerase [Enterococcus sp.]